MCMYRTVCNYTEVIITAYRTVQADLRLQTADLPSYTCTQLPCHCIIYSYRRVSAEHFPRLGPPEHAPRHLMVMVHSWLHLTVLTLLPLYCLTFSGAKNVLTKYPSAFTHRHSSCKLPSVKTSPPCASTA